MRLPDLSRLTRRRSRRGQAGLPREDILRAVPLRNPVIAWEDQESGRVLLTVPLEFKPWMKAIRMVARIPEEKKVELDELGSEVWRWADGEANVADLVGKLAAVHKLNRREAEVSLMQFLQTLAKKRYMAFALETEPDAAEAAEKGPVDADAGA